MLALLFSLFLYQSPQQTTAPTTPEARMAAYQTRLAMEDASPLKAFEMQSVGPHQMGGRIVDVAAFPDKPHTYFAAYASGGLWRTDDNGGSWRSLFDATPSITIGDIAVDPENLDRIWVGTGEENSSRSSYAGTGIHYTADGGKTWTHLGLTDTHHIGRILLHPNDSDTLWVAAIGRLYSTNAERGVYKSTDGGKTWRKTLYIDENTGVIDMAIDPANPDRLFAAAWERSRKAWNFVEGGPGSGVYISEDGGETWTAANEGLPTGEYMGRIGLSVCASSPNVVYACVDNQAPREDEDEDDDALTARKLAAMDQEAFLALEDEDIDSFFRRNRFHGDIKAKQVKEDLKAGELTMDDLVNYLGGRGSNLYDAPIVGLQVYRSDDHGKTWRLTHEKRIEDTVFTFGYYFGLIEVDPNDPDTVFVGGVPMLKSVDGGKTWAAAMKPNVHVDFHAIWINPTNSKHVVVGNDGGLNISWDGGENWQGYNRLPVGQFYTVTYDMAQPYNIYGGLQDNGVWYGPSTLGFSGARHNPYIDAWEAIGGGDGAFVQVDPRDNETVYLGLQFGNYQRRNLNDERDRVRIYPRHKLKEDPLRHNWMTPIVLSQHHHDIVYMGANRVLRSLDRGETWEPISDDLTTNPEEQGDVPFGTVTMLRESPHEFGTLYAGTDDGRLWITRSNGYEWKEISGDVTKGLWVSGIEVSPHDRGAVFITMTGYRNDDFRTYVYMSEDYGKTWTDIRGNLPDEPCNVIRQDRKNANILYLGTDVGLFISLDKGQRWHAHSGGMPNVPVYAMEAHPREHELIVATHGRSIYVMDLKTLQQMEPDTLEQDLVVFKAEKATFSESWGDEPSFWSMFPRTEPGTDFYFHAKTAGAATVEILSDGQTLHRGEIAATAGVNSWRWDYSVTPPAEKAKKKKRKKKDEAKADEEPPFHQGENDAWYAKAGEYTVRVSMGETTAEAAFTIDKGRGGRGRGGFSRPRGP